MGISTSDWHWFHQQTEGQPLLIPSSPGLACFWPGGIHPTENASRHSPSLIANATSCACPRLPRGCQSCWCPGSTKHHEPQLGQRVTTSSVYGRVRWPQELHKQKIRVFLGGHDQFKIHFSDHECALHVWQAAFLSNLTMEGPHRRNLALSCTFFRMPKHTHFTALPSASAQAMTLGSMEVLSNHGTGRRAFLSASSQDSQKRVGQASPFTHWWATGNWYAHATNTLRHVGGLYCHASPGMRLPWRPYSTLQWSKMEMENSIEFPYSWLILPVQPKCFVSSSRFPSHVWWIVQVLQGGMHVQSIFNHLNWISRCIGWGSSSQVEIDEHNTYPLVN